MGRNKTISTDHTLSLKMLSISSQIPGYEKIKISTQKMEMLPEKIDDALNLRGATAPSSPSDSYGYGSVQLLMRPTDMLQRSLSAGDEWYRQTPLRQCVGFLAFWIHGAWPWCNFAQQIVMVAKSSSSISKSKINRKYYEKHRYENSSNEVRYNIKMEVKKHDEVRIENIRQSIEFVKSHLNLTRTSTSTVNADLLEELLAVWFQYTNKNSPAPLANKRTVRPEHLMLNDPPDTPGDCMWTFIHINS